MTQDQWKLDVKTVVTHAGRHPEEHNGFVNTPVYRGSTVTFPTVASLADGHRRYRYGRWNNPTTESLNEAITILEGAEGAVLTNSGLSACTAAILALASAGDHILVPDSVYGPTRHFCGTAARRLGIETTFYDPTIGVGIEDLFKANTRVVFTESPGSNTFEVQDIPAIAEVAHRHDAFVIADNTWATPVFFKPLTAGADVSVMSGTKYLVGHSDAMIGTIAAGPRAWDRIKAYHFEMGLYVGPDDVTLAARGLRTLGTRLAQHQDSALRVARWLEAREEVERVIHPALLSHPQHEIWKRDFSGASGLFSFVTKPLSDDAKAAMLDGLSLFPMGYSWGGYESLAMPSDPRSVRTATQWSDAGQLIRLHIGLESPDDLIADLEAGLKRAFG